MGVKEGHAKDLPLYENRGPAKGCENERAIRSSIEYTYMTLLESGSPKQASKAKLNVMEKLSSFKKTMELKGCKIIFLGILGKGCGDLLATARNVPPGTEEKQYDETELLVIAASAYYGRTMDRCCCMCFLGTCFYINDQCAIDLSQLCGALACCDRVDCCFDLCNCLSSCLGG